MLDCQSVSHVIFIVSIRFIDTTDMNFTSSGIEVVAVERLQAIHLLSCLDALRTEACYNITL